MDINFEFACRDDCLDQMVPSDLRALVAERDRLRYAVADLLALPEGQKQLSYLSKGIGTETKQAAWLRASDAINPPNRVHERLVR